VPVLAPALAVAVALAAAPTPLRLTADVADAYALDVNPAGLGYLSGGELRLLYAQDGLADPAPGGPTQVNGFATYVAGQVAGPLALGFRADVDVDDLDRTGYQLGFAAALRARALAFGLAVDHLRRPGADARTRVNVGLTYRFTPWLAAAAAIQDLGQNLERRRWDLGLALRPFERVVLSGRLRLTQSAPFDVAHLGVAALLSVEPLDGLTVGLGAERSFDLGWAFTGQLALNFGQVALGGAGRGGDGGYRGVAEVVLRTRPQPALIDPSAVAVVDIAGELVPEGQLDLLRQRVVVPPYGDLPLLLETLATAEPVDGVFARIGPITAGWARAQEVRAGLLRIRAAGRRVDCLLSAQGDIAYFVATACDAVVVPPPSVLRTDGVAATVLFFGDLVKRLGLQPQVVRRGAYKSAPEQLSESGMSPAQREALGAYLDDVYAALVDSIAEGRGLTRPQVEAVLAQGTHTASQAVARGLIDHVLYPDELEEHLRTQYGRSLRFVEAGQALAPRRAPWGPRPRVAVVYVDASITGGDSTDLPFGLGQTVGARTVVQALEGLRQDPGVRAVVLRVDSPGGDSLASDLIARAVGRLAEVKPVVASLGDVAASGGYYVAAPAQLIYAEPTTLTGSIGVFSLGVSAEGLLTRLGVGVEQVTRGPLAGAQTPYLDWTEVERAHVEDGVEFYYQQFLRVVSKGRDMPVERVHAVAQGRIWSGAQARTHGLVDELGGFIEAIRRAKQEAGLDPDEEVELVVEPDSRRDLPEAVRTVADALAGLGATPTPAPALPPAVGALLGPLWSTTQPRVPMAILPFALDID
jgi:protease-4